MGDVTGQPITFEVTVEGPGTSLPPVLQAADSLASSAEPEVVFESLVHRCAPLVCEAATATVSRLDGRMHATTWPAGALHHRSQPESVVIAFDAPASGDYAGYHGLVSFRFHEQDGSSPFVAQLLVERAVSLVERARLVEAAASRDATADHLERALAPSREIGVAVGIAMANHDLTDTQAFDLLSRVSQHSEQSLGTIVREVARTGVVVLPAGVNVTESRNRRRHLESVPAPGHG